jgi:GT2 family glycosyltransferase
LLEAYSEEPTDMNEYPSVSIIIVNWNGSNDTVECVESLRRLNYPCYNILVVDNGSSPDEVRILHDAIGKHCRIIELKTNLGFAIANNVGIRIALQSDAKFVLLLNNDTIVDRNFLCELILAASKEPEVGIVGPKIYFYDKKDTIWYAGGKLNMYLGHRQEGLSESDAGQFNVRRKTNYVSGACMLIKKELLKTVGLLPREYFLGWEDIDFCFAARRAGYGCLFVPTSIVWHKASVSYKRHNLSYNQVFLGFRNRVIMRYKFLPFRKFCLFALIQILGIIPIHMVFYIVFYRDPKRIKSMLKGLWAGFRDRQSRKVLHKLPS